jgi:hypothetical protein
MRNWNISSINSQSDFFLNFISNIGIEDIIIPKNWNEINNDNGVNVVIFVMSKNLTVRNTVFPHRNIHEFIWMSQDVRTSNRKAVL